jgi:hypothetical protein
VHRLPQLPDCLQAVVEITSRYYFSEDSSPEVEIPDSLQSSKYNVVSANVTSVTSVPKGLGETMFCDS